MTDADLTLRDEVARILHDVWQNAEGPTHFDQAGADALMPLLARVCAEADNEARLSEMQGEADSLTGQLIVADAERRARAEAWDFGYACGLGDYGKSADETCSANPYREKSAR